MGSDFSQIAVSGLGAATEKMSLISNNIANDQTLGFKKIKPFFRNMFSGDSCGGVTLAENRQFFTEGKTIHTGLKTNVRLGGQGFFVVKEPFGEDESLYTRAGDFHIDKDGYLVNAQGYRVQGFTGSSPIGLLQDIQIDKGSAEQPLETKKVNLLGNLSPAENSYLQSTTLYDEQGLVHQIDVKFTKDKNTNTWNVECADRQTSTQKFDTIQLAFEKNGVLKEVSATSKGTTKAAVLLNKKSIRLEGPYHDGLHTYKVDIDVSKVTSFGEHVAGPTIDVDGYPSGDFTFLNIDDNGKIYAHYSNNQIKQTHMLGLVNFKNNNGLENVGGNNWKYTVEAGKKTEGSPGIKGIGRIYQGDLEGSNVDITEELVAIIETQKEYLADTQVIKTAQNFYKRLSDL